MSDVVGMCKHTGKGIGEAEHIQQAIDTLLTTPKGTRVMRRDWGVSFLDKDGNRLSSADASVANEVRDFVMQEEPRISSVSVKAEEDHTGLRRLEVNYVISSSFIQATTIVEYPLSGQH